MQPGPDTAGWLDTPHIRQAGAERLSLAFMDARNHTLQLLAQLEPAWGPDQAAQGRADPALSPLLWTVGEVAWFQERWIARNLQRHLGLRADPRGTRLASLLPQADVIWEEVALADRWRLPLPEADDCRAYLLQTLETTLELLEHAPDTDEALYFFRLALLHEDQQSERLLELAQALGLPLSPPMLTALTPAALARREALWLPACQWPLDTAAPGFSFDNELPRHPVPVPEFEIDAQAVSWAQYVEFVDDGGYDRESLWSPEGWGWLQALQAGEGRRGPRHVEQIGVASGAVMQRRFGQATRLSPLQPVLHVSWWEADAWCRWAGRRLPLELEWEIAAASASRRGFGWGQAWEWTAGSFRPYPGFAPGPDASYSEPWFGQAKVLRGGSTATRGRLKSTRYRHFAPPWRDDLFCGFRSCAL